VPGGNYSCIHETCECHANCRGQVKRQQVKQIQTTRKTVILKACRSIFMRNCTYHCLLVQISSAMTHSSAAASEVVTVRRICRTLFSWWRKAMIGCSEKSSTTQAMFCTDYFLLPQQRSSNTSCGVVHDRQMPDHTGHLADKNFLIRILFKDSY